MPVLSLWFKILSIENPKSKIQNRLSGTVIALGFVSLLTDISSEMTYTQIPLFVTGVLGAGAEYVGLIEGIAESAASLLKLLSGWISDHFGKRKPLAALGYAFGAASKPLMATAHLWQSVLAFRFLDRVGKGLRTAPRDALIAETTPKELRGRAFGLHRTMDTTGAVLGPLIGALFLSRRGGATGENLRALFLFAGLFGMAAVAMICFGVREPKRIEPEAPVPQTPISSLLPIPAIAPYDAAPAASSGAVPIPLRTLRRKWELLSPEYRRFLWIALLFNLGNSSDAFLILRARGLGFTALQILLLYAAFNVVEAVLGYSAGRFSDKVGRKPLIAAGYFVFAAVYLGFALASSKPAIILLFLLYGGYYTLTQGTQRAFAADMADKNQRATQIGAYHTVVGIALLPASIIAGQLFAWKPAAPFVLGAITAAGAALLLSRRS